MPSSSWIYIFKEEKCQGILLNKCPGRWVAPLAGKAGIPYAKFKAGIYYNKSVATTTPFKGCITLHLHIEGAVWRKPCG